MAGQRNAADDDMVIVVGSTMIIAVLWMLSGMMM
jgi:hypothetical protein